MLVVWGERVAVDDGVVEAEVGGGFGGGFGFVQPWVGHADGEGLDVGAELFGDRGDEGGVESTGEEEAEGDIGFEAGGDGG